MKYLIVFSVFAVLITGISSTAKAANPADWSYHLEALGPLRNEDSTSTFIDPGFSTYNYEWEITSANVLVDIDGIWQWYDVLSNIPSEYKSGSGTMGGLVISDHQIMYIDTSMITADIFLSVDINGYGTLAIDNTTFGQLSGNDIDEAIFDVYVKVTPEPATFLLFGVGVPIALGLRKKRTL